MTNTTKKLTKKNYFEALFTHIQETGVDCDGITAEDMMTFIEHEIELLSRKNSSEKKPTATQIANETLKVDILNQMEDGKLYTISDMIKELSCCVELSTSKVSSIVNKMVREDGTVEKLEEKRRSYFRKI